MKTFSQYKNSYESELLLEAFKSNKLREFVRDIKELRSMGEYTNKFNPLPNGVMWDQIPDNCIICGEPGDVDINKYAANTKYIAIWYPMVDTEIAQNKHHSTTRINSGETFIITSGKKSVSYNTKDKMSIEKGELAYNFSGYTSNTIDWEKYVDNKYNAPYINSLLQGEIPCLVLIIKKEDIVKYSSYKKMMDRSAAKKDANDSNRAAGEYDNQVRRENLIRYKTAVGNSAADKIAKAVVNKACDLITEFDNFIKEHDADKPSTLSDDMSKFFNNPNNMDLKKFANIFMVDGVPNAEGADPDYIEKFKFYKDTIVKNRSALIDSIKTMVRVIESSRKNKVDPDGSGWWSQDAKFNAIYYSKKCNEYYISFKSNFEKLKTLVNQYE